jgi:undecaprenyl-diphosphatase
LDIIYAFLLGIVEGVTEFLPISSTGHLIIVGQWLPLRPGLEDIFNIFIQLGAILSVVWLYRSRLIDLLRRLPSDRGAQRLAAALFLAFLPLAALGVLFIDVIKERLYNPVAVAVALVVGGVAMLWLDRDVKRSALSDLEAIPPRVGLAVGVAQALSLIPGVSRSAATILGGLGMGMDRRTAVEFSFFLSIPTMLVATVYDLVKNASDLGGSDWLILAVGAGTAFVTALLVIQLFLRYISTNSFLPFAIYRIVLGGLLILLFLAGIVR